MGSKSRSSNSTTNNVTNYSLQGFENAQAAVAGNNNTVTITDQGAIEKAFAFAEEQSSDAFRFGESALELGDKVVDANGELARVVVAANGAVVGDALKQGFGFGESALETNNEVIKQGFGFADSLVQQNTANTANATLAMKELAKSVSTGGASDITDLTAKTVYTMGAVIAVVFLGMLLLRGRS